jgi:hypothetical protein
MYVSLCNCGCACLYLFGERSEWHFDFPRTTCGDAIPIFAQNVLRPLVVACHIGTPAAYNVQHLFPRFGKGIVVDDDILRGVKRVIEVEEEVLGCLVGSKRPNVEIEASF